MFIRAARFKDRVGMDACNRRNLPENYSMNMWENHLRSHPYHSFVLTDGSIIHGYLLSDGNTILSFAVDELYRGQGYGHALMEKFFSCHNGPISLQVRVSNLKAQKLYRQFGFAITDTLKGYYQDGENGLLMTRTD